MLAKPMGLKELCDKNDFLRSRLNKLLKRG